MIPLDLSFKGERTYLHGTDLLTVLQEGVAGWLDGGDWWVSNLAFRNFASNQFDLHFEKPDLVVVTEGRFRRLDNERRFWLTESDRPVTGRYPFDEDGLVAGAEISVKDRTAALAVSGDHTTIEAVVALTKRLNYAVTPDVDGKWVFGQLQLDRRLPDRCGQVGIAMKSVVAGRFSVNRIAIDGKDIGTIRFIVGTP